MTRIIAFLFGILALGAALAWLADRPGTVSMVWQGYRIETSAMALFIGIILLTAALVFLWQVYRAIMGAPGSITDFFRNRRRVKGYEALSQGMIAVGAGDSRFASSQAKQARKLLSNEPLVGLLTAQAAQLADDKDGARAAFEAMLDTPETTLLGLHGLFVEAQRQGNEAAARRCATEASRRAPGLAWAAEAQFGFQVRDGAWDDAMNTLERMESNRLVGKTGARRQRAVLLTGKALELEDNQPEQALRLALEAHKLVPDLVPAAVVAGRIYGGLSKLSQAASIIEKTWKIGPHPDLADVYAHLRSGDTTQDRYKRVKSLAKKKTGHSESRMAVARAAIDAGEWNDARDALEPLIARTPTRRVCVMMAQIEDSEHGDRGRVREWLARAVHAPRDPAWVADGRISDTWAAVSPVTGTLDGYAWMVPEDESDAAAAHVLEALGTMQPDAPLIQDAAMIPDASTIDVSADTAAETDMASVATAEIVDPAIGHDNALDAASTENHTAKRDGPTSADTETTGLDAAVDTAPIKDNEGSAIDQASPIATEQGEGKSESTPTKPDTPVSKGHQRAVEAGAVMGEGGEGGKSEGDKKAKRIERPDDNTNDTPGAPTDNAKTETPGGGSKSSSKRSAKRSTNGRRVGPEAVAGVAVAAQESIDEIQTRVLPSQPDDPGPLDDHEESEADRKKWMGLFN
jgi:HemY protein